MSTPANPLDLANSSAAPMPTPLDFTNSADAKSWAGITSNNTDVMVQKLITGASKQIITYIGRNPFVATYNEVRDGNGNDSLSLWNWPIISVSALTIADQNLCWNRQPVWPLSGNPATVPSSLNAVTTGFIVDSGPDYTAPSRITLVGYRFTRGRSNVRITYQAGFTVTFPEAQTVAAGTFTLNEAATFVADFGVTYANGTALTLVTTPPLEGQYSCTAGVYAVNTADNGKVLTVTYQFGQVPYDLVQACIEIVGADLKRRSHIDQDSVVVEAQSTNYTRLPIPRKVQLVLNQYRVRMLMA